MPTEPELSPEILSPSHFQKSEVSGFDAANAVTVRDEVSIAITRKDAKIDLRYFKNFTSKEKNMIELILTLIALAFVVTWNRHYIATKDSSIQGYVEYLKEKYYYKKKD